MASKSDGAATAPEATQDYLYMVFDDPAAGQETEFNRWYDEEHIKDIVAVTGFFSGRRYVKADDQVHTSVPAKPKYMVMYHFRSETPEAVKAELDRLVTSGATKVSPALDVSSVESYTFNLLKKGFNGTSGLSAMDAGDAPDYFELVYDSPVDEAQSAALNAWYDDHHMDELMANAGYINGYRGIWADVQFEPGQHESTYFALLAFRTPDVPAFAAALQTKTPPPAALDQDRAYRYTYRALGPYIMSGKVREERAAK